MANDINALTYFQQLHALQQQSTTVRRETGVAQLIKQLSNLQTGELDPLLPYVHQQISDNTLNQNGQSNAMLALHFKGTIPAEIAMLTWRHSMHQTGLDISLGVSVDEIIIRQVPVRIYKPANHQTKRNSAIVYYHGGGFIGGSINITEGFIKLLAQYSGAIVFSVDYHYAPEFSAKKTISEAVAILDDIQKNAAKFQIDTQAISLFGDSSGANLVMAIIQTLIAEHRMTLKQTILAYPVITLDEQQYLQLAATDSVVALNRQGQKKTPFRQKLAMVQEVYLQNNFSSTNPLVSPFNMSQDVAAAFPRTLIITAELDDLRPHSKALADLLSQAGVSVQQLYYANVTHAFLNDTGVLPQAQDAAWETGLWLHQSI